MSTMQKTKGELLRERERLMEEGRRLDLQLQLAQLAEREASVPLESEFDFHARNGRCLRLPDGTLFETGARWLNRSMRHDGHKGWEPADELERLYSQLRFWTTRHDAIAPQAEALRKTLAGGPLGFRWVEALEEMCGPPPAEGEKGLEVLAAAAAECAVKADAVREKIIAEKRARGYERPGV